MPLVIRRMTLLRHVWTVLITPFLVILVGCLTHGWILLACVVLYGVCVVLGAPADFRALDREDFFVGFGMIAVLWLVAAFLTIVDHIRYHGWETCPPDSEAVLCVTAFVGNLRAEDFGSAYDLCTRSFHSREDRQRFAQSAAVVCASPFVVDLDERTVARNLPVINAVVADEGVAAIALFAFSDQEDGYGTRLPGLLMTLQNGPDGPRIAAFDQVTISLA